MKATIQEERLADGVVMRAGFNRDAVFNQDVGGLQDVFAAVHEIGEMMKPTPCATSIQGDRKVIGLEGCRQPTTHFGAVIENDLLGHAKPEELLKKLPVGFNVLREQVEPLASLKNGARWPARNRERSRPRSTRGRRTPRISMHGIAVLELIG